MYRRAKYVLLLLTLVLFGFASIGYSQDEVEQPNRESNPIEQSTEESKNRFQISIIIFVALIILIFALAIFSMWKMGSEKKKSNEIVQELQGVQRRLDESIPRFAESLDYIHQVCNGNAQQLEEIESKQSSIGNEQENIRNIIAKIRGSIDVVEQTVKDLEDDKETDNTIEYQREADVAVQDAQERVAELARAYRDGEPIDFIEIATPKPSQKVHLIARYLHQWKNELAQSAQDDSQLVQILTSVEEKIKDELKAIRGEVLPSPKPLDLGTDINTDTDLAHIRNQCIDYVARFEGMLSGYELGHEVDEATYAQLIPQLIKNQIFNNVARFIPFEQLSEQVGRFLQLADYEVVPIEIGKTEADARVHDIQGSQQTDVDSGTVAEIITHGLKRKIDGVIVQKPVVIRGE